METLIEEFSKMQASQRALRNRTKHVQADIAKHASPALSRFLLSRTQRTKEQPVSLSRRLRSDPLTSGLLAAAVTSGIVGAAALLGSHKRKQQKLAEARSEYRQGRRELDEQDAAFNESMRRLLEREAEERERAAQKSGLKPSMAISATVSLGVSSLGAQLKRAQRLNNAVLTDRETLRALAAQFDALKQAEADVNSQLEAMRKERERLDREINDLEDAVGEEHLERLGPISQRMVEENARYALAERRLVQVRAKVAQKQRAFIEQDIELKRVVSKVRARVSELDAIASTYESLQQPVPKAFHDQPDLLRDFLQGIRTTSEALVSQLSDLENQHALQLQAEQARVTAKEGELEALQVELEALQNTETRVKKSRLAKEAAEKEVGLLREQRAAAKQEEIESHSALGAVGAFDLTLAQQARQRAKDYLEQAKTLRSQRGISEGAVRAQLGALAKDLALNPETATFDEVIEASKQKIATANKDFSALKWYMSAQQAAQKELVDAKKELGQVQNHGRWVQFSTLTVKAIDTTNESIESIKEEISAADKAAKGLVSRRAAYNQRQQQEAAVGAEQSKFDGLAARFQQLQEDIEASRKELEGMKGGNNEEEEEEEEDGPQKPPPKRLVLLSMIADEILRFRTVVYRSALALQVSADVLAATREYRNYQEHDTPLRVLLAKAAFPEQHFPMGRRLLSLPLEQLAKQGRMLDLPHVHYYHKDQISYDEAVRKKVADQGVWSYDEVQPESFSADWESLEASAPTFDLPEARAWERRLRKGSNFMFMLQENTLDVGGNGVLYNTAYHMCISLGERPYVIADPKLKSKVRRAAFVQVIGSFQGSAFGDVAKTSGLRSVAKKAKNVFWIRTNDYLMILFMRGSNQVRVFHMNRGKVVSSLHVGKMMELGDNDVEASVASMYTGAFHPHDKTLTFVAGEDSEPVTEIYLFDREKRASAIFTPAKPLKALAAGTKVEGTLLRLGDEQRVPVVLEMKMEETLPQGLSEIAHPFRAMRQELESSLQYDLGAASRLSMRVLEYQVAYQLTMKMTLCSFAVRFEGEKRPDLKMYLSDKELPSLSIFVAKVMGEGVIEADPERFKEKLAKELEARRKAITSHTEKYGGAWAPSLDLTEQVTESVMELLNNKIQNDLKKALAPEKPAPQPAVQPAAQPAAKIVAEKGADLYGYTEGRLDEWYFRTLGQQEDVGGKAREKAARALINRADDATLWGLVEELDPGKWKSAVKVKKLASSIRSLNQALGAASLATPANADAMDLLSSLYDGRKSSAGRAPRDPIACLDESAFA